MKKFPSITTARGVEIYREMLSVRRLFAADTDFFKMTDFWRALSDGGDYCRINTFDSGLGENFLCKAGVIAFNSRVTLSVDKELWKRADEGCRTANFILAHEMGHVALNHHEKQAVTKNFVLYSSPRGMANIPPTAEELEANYAAVFLQCGVALEQRNWEPLRLASRAMSDISYVKRLQLIVGLDVFQRELRLKKLKIQRVIL